MALYTLDPIQAQIAALRLQISNRESALTVLDQIGIGDGPEACKIMGDLGDLARELDELLDPGHNARIAAEILAREPETRALVARLMDSAKES